VNRRILLLVAFAVAVLGLAWWLRRADARALGAWRPPRVWFGQDLSGPSADAPPEGGRDWGVVSCTVDAALGELPGRLVATAEEGGANVVSTAVGRDLTLNLAPGEWRVTWHADAEGRRVQMRRVGLVEVEAGSVDRCRIEGSGWTLTGRVLDADGDPVPDALVEGCDAAGATTDEAGRFSLVARRGDCLIRAWSRDGQLRRPGEREYFDPFLPPASLDLRVDTSAIGGVGMGLSAGTDGLVVSFVTEGSPAAAAGVESGEVVVAVNGTSTAGWTVIQGVEAITGPPGSPVTLRFRVESGEEDELVLTRARIAETSPADTGNLLAP
jgi:hypothetical protein